jgi:hypothetical protein
LLEAPQPPSPRIRTLSTAPTQIQAAPRATFNNDCVFDLGNRREDGKPNPPIQLAFTGGFIV